MQLGVHPVAVVGKFVKKIGKRQLYKKGEAINKTTQKRRYTKYKTDIQTRKQIYKDY
jgi:hypothetical protein